MWGRMAAAAVTRGTPGGKSRGVLPASPPPRQGAPLRGRAAGARRGDPRPSSRLAPTPAPVLLPRARGRRNTQGPAADLRRRHLWGTPRPGPTLAAARPRALSRGVSGAPLRAGGRRTLPRRGFSGDPRPGPLRTLAGCRAGTAHLRPGAESLPRPSCPAHGQRGRASSPLHPGHLAEPAAWSPRREHPPASICSLGRVGAQAGARVVDGVRWAWRTGEAEAFGESAGGGGVGRAVSFGVEDGLS